MIQESKQIIEILKLDILKIIFSSPYKRDENLKKCVAMPKIVSGKSVFQFETFKGNQAFHENVSFETLFDAVLERFENTFSQMQIFTKEYIYSLKLSKKGKLLQTRCKNQEYTENISNLSHNKKKNYIIDVENAPQVLVDLGIITNDGKIINSMYDKFKQICRFCEMIDDVVSKDEREEYNIVDFGCGKSYLTFVVYHYFTKIKGKKVNITGLDLKKDVIEKCNSLSKKYGCENLTFLCMDVKDYVPKNKVDMVIALHACDIATDYALYSAYKWNSDYIFSVPCCQHEMNKNIKNNTNSMFCDYGLIKERFCALATDTIRAKLLESVGFSVDILEFVSPEFSPKNTLIRARHSGKINFGKKKKALSQIKDFENMFECKITLQKLLYPEE